MSNHRLREGTLGSPKIIPQSYFLSYGCIHRGMIPFPQEVPPKRHAPYMPRKSFRPKLQQLADFLRTNPLALHQLSDVFIENEAYPPSFPAFRREKTWWLGDSQIFIIFYHQISATNSSGQEVDEMIRMCDSDGDGQVRSGVIFRAFQIYYATLYYLHI